MFKKVIEKRKAIILNEEGKVLVFYKDGEISLLKYPTIKEENKDYLPLLSLDNLNSFEPLTFTNDEMIRTSITNGHLIKTLNIYKTYYYAIMHTLTGEEKEKLIEISARKRLLPHFLSIEELITYFEYEYYKKYSLTDYYSSKLEPIRELEKVRKKERENIYARY